VTDLADALFDEKNNGNWTDFEEIYYDGGEELARFKEAAAYIIVSPYLSRTLSALKEPIYHRENGDIWAAGENGPQLIRKLAFEKETAR
jgi:hypothetical protein